jgi:hypothetical protein
MNRGVGQTSFELGFARKEQWGSGLTRGQWEIPHRSTSLPGYVNPLWRGLVRYHVWDSAWIPDGLAGKTIEEVGNSHEHLLELTSKELKRNFAHYNQRAIDAVRALTDLDRIVHLSYGDFPAKEYLQHNVSARAFMSYDIAKLIGADTTMTDDVVQALMDEFSPVVEGYRKMGLFPPEVKVASDASPQTKLLAMVGRE